MFNAMMETKAKICRYLHLFSEMLVEDKHYYKVGQELLQSGATLLQSRTVTTNWAVHLQMDTSANGVPW